MGRPRLYTDEERKERKKIASQKADKKYYYSNPEKAREKSKKWYWKNHDRARSNNIKYVKENPDKEKARQALRWKNNSEEEKTRARKWRKLNPDKIRKQHAAWWEKNAVRMRALSAEWKKTHPEKLKAYNHNRRALVTGNGGKLSPDLEAKMLAFQKNRCAICRTSLKKTGYHLDHIIPFARGGKNVDRNIQLTCPKCNREKYSKDPIQFMREKGFLL